jgi:hypothetical protein
MLHDAFFKPSRFMSLHAMYGPRPALQGMHGARRAMGV